MRLRAAIAALMLSALPAWAELTIPVHYLRQIVPQPPTLSNLDPRPERLGIDGASLALADNQTTGQFLGQTYTLEITEVPEGGDFAAAMRTALAATPFVILDAPADTLLTVADMSEAGEALLFNASAPGRRLRSQDCRPNLFHTIPSLDMRTDALMQFLLSRRWTGLALIHGTHAEDLAFADALTNSAGKFGLKIGATKEWAFDADMRRNAAQEMPLFTQDLGRHDVLLLADEIGDFALYIPYNTWEPRPVAGSEGLRPVAWDRVVEQWGAAQLQSRFEDLAARPMRPLDYAAWAAFRAIGEAVTRTGTDDPAALRAYMLSDAFELAGFKGRPLTFRSWNGQLRQPIPLVHAHAQAALAPLDGFLHPRTELDTLGLDAPESGCARFR
ncbi:ABC transporter substrate-binding protein [Primorskyibacter marinus]|uniref:ABC transporter substrate-binding protein n=1 Tax=Primorskyibacter marinus TaxID=1977320 RepID=UPI000E301819|nr:ABC transporter substrate-binding protein [Primorskyibacter marinus]